MWMFSGFTQEVIYAVLSKYHTWMEGQSQSCDAHTVPVLLMHTVHHLHSSRLHMPAISH